MLFAAIISFILSNLIALSLFFTGKKLHPAWFRVLATLHLMAGILFVFKVITNRDPEPEYPSFLAFICLGIIAGGLALGTRKHIVFKLYFGLYCLSVFLFIISPSTLLNFLMTGQFTSGDQLIPVSANYYLESQRSRIAGSDTTRVYKLIQKNGMFHKTVARDLHFPGKLDSIKVLRFSEKESALIRGYSGQRTFVEDRIDSLDVNIDLNAEKKDKIERKL